MANSRQDLMDYLDMKEREREEFVNKMRKPMSSEDLQAIQKRIIYITYKERKSSFGCDVYQFEHFAKNINFELLSALQTTKLQISMHYLKNPTGHMMLQIYEYIKKGNTPGLVDTAIDGYLRINELDKCKDISFIIGRMSRNTDLYFYPKDNYIHVSKNSKFQKYVSKENIFKMNTLAMKYVDQ
eukprot:220200_1